MKKKPLRVLILEDKPSDAELMIYELQQAGFEPKWERVESESDYLVQLQRPFDIILSDYTMPQFDAVLALNLLKEQGLNIPFVVVTGSISEEVAVECMKQGASDYLLKDRLVRLGPAVVRALDQKRLRGENRRAEEALRESEERYRSLFENMVEGYTYCRMLYENGQPCDFVYLDVNPAFERLTGLRNVLGKRVSEVIPGIQQSNPEMFEICGRVASVGAPERFETYIERLAEWFSISVYSREKECFVAVFDIITQRRQAEAALRRSEGKFRELYDHAPVGYHEYDAQGRITDVNRTDLEMLGYTAAEMIGQPVWSFNVEEKEAREQILAKLAGTLPPARSIERIYRRKDGTTLSVLCQDRLILNEKGEIKSIRCTIQDITELKRRDEALRKSEKEAKRLAHENAIMAEIGRIISSTLNVEEVYERFTEQVRQLIPFDQIMVSLINPTAQTLTVVHQTGVVVPDRHQGDVFPLEGTITQKVMDQRAGMIIRLRNEQTVRERLPFLLSTFRSGIRSGMSVPLFSKDQIVGTLHLRSLDPEAYTAEDLTLADRVGNQIAGAIASAQIYAEHKRMEEAQRQSEEKFRQLFEEAPIGYHEVDREGRITRINQTELMMLGYSEEEMIGRPSWEFVADPEDLRRNFGSKISGVVPVEQSFERTYLRKDGTTLVALSGGRLLRDKEGRVTGIRTTVLDITERKEHEQKMKALEDQLRQSQKVEAIGQLAGGIAHDFNNLLTVIRGYSQLSLSELQKGDPLWANIEEIQEAAKRAADLTRQLLAFSRKQILEMRVIDLNQVLQRLDKMLRRVIGEDIELTMFLPELIWKVKADPGQIEQVIMNLSVNARDAMPEGGKLTIETANVELDEEYARKHIAVQPGRYMMLSVSDTGIGMTPEVKERIFDPFFTTKEKGKGTGLGLSTVYGIVKQSGGNIWVYSEPGRGTTFKIYLPWVDEPLEELREEVVKEISGGHETILIVEDEDVVRKLAVRVLKKQEYKVLEAPDGEKAFILCEEFKEPIHLILTDVVMPGMSGRKLVDRLKEIHPETKILYMSGYTDNAILHHGILEPGINFIQKPFNVDGLARKVREVLDQ